MASMPHAIKTKIQTVSAFYFMCHFKDIIKLAELRTAVFSFEPMCVVVIIAIQFKSANQRPRNLWLKT